ncbi:TlpA family protein disulfide reductase [Streptomyces sp. CHD11]|uniref:TlpA disulfide reductase family protein n=1 Tax=Streptomyces sp. CHD11 TaxID=2741325 RepID=UPI001BFC4CEB|nr:TlpA disulfide reductase family protein [Streptomyces sp. CHD11]MBT3154271.1 TlpA family protein disulfide reductase [Streptomyces sp. CHD11]
MPFLITAVVFVGLLCAVDLVLTLGVVARLREHSGLLSGAERASGLGMGETVGGFQTADLNGVPLSRETLGPATFVAFISPTCGSCKEKLPELVRFARRLRDEGEEMLAVVVGDAEESRPFAADLRPVARVTVEGSGGPLGTAFRATSYPTMLWVARHADGRLVRVERSVALTS